jgi:hypothetical protein
MVSDIRAVKVLLILCLLGNKVFISTAKLMTFRRRPFLKRECIRNFRDYFLVSADYQDVMRMNIVRMYKENIRLEMGYGGNNRTL